jgi:hypothetical protein
MSSPDCWCSSVLRGSSGSQQNTMAAVASSKIILFEANFFDDRLLRMAPSLRRKDVKEQNHIPVVQYFRVQSMNVNSQSTDAHVLLLLCTVGVRVF